MEFCICPRCAAIYPGAPRCPACGEPTVPFDRVHHEQLLAAQTARRMQEQLMSWVRGGLLDHQTASRLIARLPSPYMPPAAPAPAPAPAASPAPPREQAAALAAAPLLAATAADALIDPGEATAGQDAGPDGLPDDAPGGASGAAGGAAELPDTSGALDHGGHDHGGHDHGGHDHRTEAAQLGALAALAAVDEADGAGGGGSSWVYENIGWFLGATLVLAGSLYGVREAWQSLGDVSRHLVVVGALLGYHGGFVGVGALLGRSEQAGSQAAGRVLAAIGWLLLPVVAIGLSSLVEARAAVGLATALGAGALTFWTQRSVAARFGGGSTLAWSTLPALASMLPVASFAAGSWPRQLAPLLGLVGLGVAARAGDGWALLAAATASLASWTFSVTGAPGEALASRASGSITAAAAALWVAGFAAALREALGREPIRQRAAGLVDALRWVGLALLACASLGAGLGLLALGDVDAASEALRRPVLLAYLAAAATATVAFARAQRASPGALHLLAPAATLAGLLAGAVLRPGPVGLLLGAALSASSLLVWGERQDRVAAAVWGLLVGGVTLLLGLAGAGATPLAFAPAVLLTLATHRAARRWAPLHYVGGLFAALLARSVALSLEPAGGLVPHALLALGAAHGVVGLLARERASVGALDGSAPPVDPADSPDGARGGADGAPRPAAGARTSWRPLEDVSLLVLLGAVVPLLAMPPLPTWVQAPVPDAWPSLREVGRELAHQGVALAAAALLGARAWRDRSALVGAAASLTAALALLRTWPMAWLADAPAFLLGALALGLGGAAAALHALPASEPAGPRRRFLGALPMPRSARPLAEGAGIASAVVFLAGQAQVLGWLGDLSEPRRPLMIQACALLLAASALWFLTPALSVVRARGALPALATAGLAGVMTALANRLGRPLSPDQTALRLTVVAVILYGTSELLASGGERLGAWLGRPSHGRRYHVLATVGLAALGVVLLVDASHLMHGPLPLLGAPPLFVLGASLAALLLARRTRWPAALHLALALWPAGVALAVAQGSLLGGPFVQQADRSWLASVPALAPSEQLERLAASQQRALLGVAAGGLAMALGALLARRPSMRAVAAWLLDGDEPEAALASSLSLAAALSAAACVVASVGTTGRPASAGVALIGLALAAGSWRAPGALLVGAGAALALHAQSLAAPAVPRWAGPSLAALALGALGLLEARPRTRPGAVLLAHLFAAAVLGLGLLHALAAGAPTTPGAGVGSLLTLAFAPTSAGTLGAPTFALTLALTAAAAALASRQAARDPDDGRSGWLAALPAPLLAAAYGLGHLAASRLADPLSADPRRTLLGLLTLVSRSVGHLTAASAVVALGAHAVSRALRPSRARGGVSWGRDLVLVGALCLASWQVARSSGNSIQPTGSTLQAALGLVVASSVAVHAAWREASARHVYFVQLAVIALYAVLRSATGDTLPREADAVFGLALGFVLLGVTVLARRSGLPPVARATRLFAALLPLGVALALGDQTFQEQAAGALASAALYGSLAWVERSRALGTLGAVAVNLALLLAALAGGLDGLEIYLAPLGLFLLALGHLFHRTLEPHLRQWLRVLGSLLLYLPAAWSITFQLGRAPDARYPLAFGAVCLAGVAAGLLLRLRAYLLLGSAFLVLDIIANLVHAGLRNHRLGFAILSAAGLAVLGGMVLSTLRRDAVQHVLRRFRTRLATWE